MCLIFIQSLKSVGQYFCLYTVHQVSSTSLISVKKKKYRNLKKWLKKSADSFWHHVMLKFQNKRDNSLQNEVYMFSLWPVVLFVIYFTAYEVFFYIILPRIAIYLSIS